MRKSDYFGGQFEGNQCNKLILAGSKLTPDKTLYSFKTRKDFARVCKGAGQGLKLNPLYFAGD